MKSNFQFKLVLSISLMGFHQIMLGCSYVFSSMVLAKLRDPGSTIKLNSEEASWIASVPILICPIGLLITGILTDKIGRRKSLQLAYIPLILSWLTLAYADSYTTILIGRIILGFTLGSGTCVYLYLAEVSPAGQRPFFNSMISVFGGMGNILESLLAFFFPWNTVSLVLAVASTVGCVSLFFVPEPPMWLNARGRVADAEAAERWFGRAADKDAAAGDGEAAVPSCSAVAPSVDAAAAASMAADSDPHRRRRWWSAYARPAVWKPALITLGFFVCQQCSGIYLMIFYSADVLRDCHVPWDDEAVTVFLFVTRVASCVVFASLHRVKRKTLAAASCVGMATSLTVIIAYTKAFSGVTRPPYGPLIVAAFTVFVYSGQIGMLPMPWTLCGEVFPMDVKGTMNGVVQTCGYLFMFAVIKIYPLMVSSLGIIDVWTLCTYCCVLSTLFCLFILPETKGVPLDVILTYFEPHKKTTSNDIS